MTPAAGDGWLRLAALMSGLEAVVLTAVGGFEIANLDSRRLVIGLTTAIFFFGYAAGLALASFGVARLRSWARAPVVLTQLILLGLGWSLHGTGTTWLAVLLAVPALVVLVIMVRPATTAALYGGADSDDTTTG